MAISQYYVDPSAGNDTTGDGSSGTPWKTVQKALNTITRNATDGDQINVKDSADDVLSAPLSFSAYGTPSSTAPISLRGCTTTAGDGGIGGISGGGSVAVVSESTLDYILLLDLHLHNCGSAQIVLLDRYCMMINCELDNTTGNGASTDIYSAVIKCYFHNIGGSGFTGNITVQDCTFENGTNKFTNACVVDLGGSVSNCVFDLDSSSDGIVVKMACVASNNSVYSNGGTGQGIRVGNGGNAYGNLVEGFSGAGGIGIQAYQVWTNLLGHNSIQNCTTDYSSGNEFGTLTVGNESLSATPFTSASTNDFTPVDTGLVKQGSYPPTIAGFSTATKKWRGAIEPAEPAGGGGGDVRTKRLITMGA